MSTTPLALSEVKRALGVSRLTVRRERQAAYRTLRSLWAACLVRGGHPPRHLATVYNAWEDRARGWVVAGEAMISADQHLAERLITAWLTRVVGDAESAQRLAGEALAGDRKSIDATMAMLASRGAL